MVVLEKEVLDRLRDFAGDAGDIAVAVQAVKDEVSEIREEIDIDNVVADYVRRRKAVEESENKLRKLMKSKDEQWIEDIGLQEALQENGFAVSGWRRLVAEAGDGLGPGGGGAGETTVNMLALVLNELTQLMENRPAEGGTGAEAKEKATEVLDRVGREVDASLDRTERKLDALASEMDGVRSGDTEEDRDEPTRSRKDWALISEIVQEICQPLTVINCTMELLSSDRFGTLPEAGRQPVGMAQSCVVRLRKLAQELVEICGVPTSLSPDNLTQ